MALLFQKVVKENEEMALATEILKEEKKPPDEQENNNNTDLPDLIAVSISPALSRSCVHFYVVYVLVVFALVGCRLADILLVFHCLTCLRIALFCCLSILIY